MFGALQRKVRKTSQKKQFHEYEVLKPTPAKSGKTAPWFGEPGGDTQYKFDKSIEDLMGSGNLRRIK